MLLALSPHLGQTDVTQLLGSFRHLAFRSESAIRRSFAYNYPALLKVAAAHSVTHLLGDTFKRMQGDPNAEVR